MKKFFLVLAGVGVLATGSVAMTTENSSAAMMYKKHQVCRVVTQKKKVMRNGHWRTVTTKVRRCHWV
jgi:hypothetical protein